MLNRDANVAATNTRTEHYYNIEALRRELIQNVINDVYDLYLWLKFQVRDLVNAGIQFCKTFSRIT